MEQGIHAATFQRHNGRIAVLGPEDGEEGRRKREEIRDVLWHEGYDTFFPEDEGSRSLGQDLEKLRPHNVLPILLMTEQSAVDGLDLARFRDAPDIMDKLALLFPKDSFDPLRNAASKLAGDAGSMRLYTRAGLDQCQVVSESRKFAEEWSLEPQLGELLQDETQDDSDFGRT